jgi:nucleotide-binding universal stress UspA family protein
VINLKTPERRQDAGRSRRGGAGVLVVVLDEAGLAEALPVAIARATALGGRVTVAGTARMPFWWAVAASGWMMMPRPWAEESRLRAEDELRAQVARLSEDTECRVLCRHGRAEVWLARILMQGRYETVLVGASRLGRRRARRLEAIAGDQRTFALLTPLATAGPSRVAVPGG